MANKREISGKFIITEDEFFGKYKPVINHIERAKQPKSVADEDICSWSGTLYETFSPEVDHIIAITNNPKTKKKVWTLVDGDEDKQYILAGYHHINRQGYFITKKSWVSGDEEVKIDD